MSEAFEEKAAIIEFCSGRVDRIKRDKARRAVAERLAREPGMIVPQGPWDATKACNGVMEDES